VACCEGPVNVEDEFGGGRGGGPLAGSFGGVAVSDDVRLDELSSLTAFRDAPNKGGCTGGGGGGNVGLLIGFSICGCAGEGDGDRDTLVVDC
jgi:hypothetical protein